MNRSIIVDNNVPSIVYSGPWLASESGLILPGTLATPPYSNTVHMITTTGSFRYPFRGSKIMVVGYMPNLNTTIPEPWNCAIDGNTIPNTPIGRLASTPLLDPNAFSLCSWHSHIDWDSHNLTVTITNADQEHPFYFDYIEYSPTQSAAFDNATTVLVNPNDTGIKYSDGQWDPVSLGKATSGPTSNFTFTFRGVSLALYGYRGNARANITIDDVMATYFIDDNNPVSSDLSPNDANSPVLLFETPQLPNENHTLRAVVYHPNVTATVPFILHALIVQNIMAPPALSTATYPNPTVTATPTLISSPQIVATSGSSRQTLTPIAGGVIGGLVIFLALVLLAFFILLRRRRKNNNNVPVLLNACRKSEISPHPERKASVYRPPPPSPDSALSSPCLSYTSRSEYHHASHAPVNGYWDAISLDAQTHAGDATAHSPWDDGIAENGLLKRPDGLRSAEDADVQAARIGLPSNPAVYLEAHKRALRQLLGIGPAGVGSCNALPMPQSVTDKAIRADVGRNRQSELLSTPRMLEELNKEEGRLN